MSVWETMWPLFYLGASQWSTPTQRMSLSLMKGTGWNDSRSECDGTAVVGSGQSGALGRTPKSLGSIDVQTEGHTVDGWFSSVDRFIVIHLDVVCALSVSSMSKKISALPHNFIWGFL